MSFYCINRKSSDSRTLTHDGAISCMGVQFRNCPVGALSGRAISAIPASETLRALAGLASEKKQPLITYVIKGCSTRYHLKVTHLVR